VVHRVAHDPEQLAVCRLLPEPVQVQQLPHGRLPGGRRALGAQRGKGEVAAVLGRQQARDLAALAH